MQRSAEEGREGEVIIRSREGKEEEAEERIEGQEIGGREGGIDRHWVGRRKREGEREKAREEDVEVVGEG